MARRCGDQQTSKREFILSKIFLEALCTILLVGSAGCASFGSRTNVEIKEGLGLFESLIPVSPDSVIELYEDFEPARFHQAYKEYLAFAQRCIDTLNGPLDSALRIDTLAIDHAIENFGNAARTKHTIFISSSYFFLFNNPSIIRSVLSHEFGHIYFERLSPGQLDILSRIWRALQGSALFYLFRDGEYSGNAKFGGHPDDSLAELFASAFNLLRNRADELDVRLRYVDPDHYKLVEELRSLVSASMQTTAHP